MADETHDENATPDATDDDVKRIDEDTGPGRRPPRRERGRGRRREPGPERHGAQRRSEGQPAPV